MNSLKFTPLSVISCFSTCTCSDWLSLFWHCADVVVHNSYVLPLFIRPVWKPPRVHHHRFTNFNSLDEFAYNLGTQFLNLREPLNHTQKFVNALYLRFSLLNDFISNNPGADYDEYKNRLGNLTLLEKPINIVVSNDFFLKKCKEYCKNLYKLSLPFK